MDAGEHVSRGFEHQRLGRLDEALAEYNKAVEIAARYSGPWMARGELFMKMERYDQAVADFTRAIQCEPKSSKGYAWRSEARYANGDIAGSDADAETAKKLAEKEEADRDRNRGRRMGREMQVLGGLMRDRPGADPTKLMGIAGRQVFGEELGRMSGKPGGAKVVIKSVLLVLGVVIALVLVVMMAR